MASSAASIANPARCAIPRIAKGKSSDGRVCIVKLNDEHGFEHRVCRLSITKLFNYPLGNLVLQWPHSRKSGNGVPRMVDESTTAVEEIKEEKRPKGKRAKKAARGKRAAAAGKRRGAAGQVAYPKDSLAKSLRIPQAILEQNAGNPCTPKEAAGFARIGLTGEIGVEISSATKYGLLERPSPGKVKPTELVRKIARPEDPKDRLEALRQAVLTAPVISDMYKRYRGEYLPDKEFLRNTAINSFGVAEDQADGFIGIFLQTLGDAELLQDIGDGKTRVLDVTTPTSGAPSSEVGEEQIRKLSKGVTVQATDTCFVVMPFADPIGGYYETIYQPAIERAKLKPNRADADIYGTGKIIDQIWRGINSARVLVAELTGRNPNVLYELGLAHALKKPVVLVSSNKDDVPFDVQHVRVIYYDRNDPFWGQKLIEKVAENILSALQDPKDAILFRDSK